MKSITLAPTYWASVSGGKDSLFMLNYILHNLDKYPLDGVIHFDLDIDYPFVKDVVSFMRERCLSLRIPFVIVPTSNTWEELYYKKYNNGSIYGFPSRRARWCNSRYKLSALRNFNDYKKSLGYNVYYYIGYCYDEFKRYNKRVSPFERFPLVEAKIYEDTILKWAQHQPIFNDYYKYNKRCGCMYCPMASMVNFAYLYKYYPDNFNYMIDKMRETEKIRFYELGRPYSCISSNPKYNADYLEHIVKTKYVHYLDNTFTQLSFID